MPRFSWGMRLSLNAHQHVLTFAFYFSTTCDISSTALAASEVNRNLPVGEEVVGEEVWVEEGDPSPTPRQKASRFWTQSSWWVC
jgi:hypothetical protein